MMSSQESTRFPERVLKRYAELILRHVYQSGGRERYVRVAEIEDSLGLEQDLILTLCRTRLLGEVHVADRPPSELENDVDYCSPIERQLVRDLFSEPHVRIRPAAVRLTEGELLFRRKKRRKRRQK
ncbi:MAG: hypothetical protein ACYTGZ_12315 [Planctomycetota bacterium]|jgi:hypothetical protein